MIKTRFGAQTWQGGSFGLGAGPAPFIFTAQGFPAADGDMNGDGFSGAASNSNGDAYSDLAITMPDGLAIFAGTPSGFPSTRLITLPGSTPAALASGDFNGDGQSDLIVNDGGTLLAHYGASGAPATAGVPLTTPPLPAVDQSRGAVGDVNGDGYDDLTVGVFALDPTDQKDHVRSAVLHLGGPTGLDPTGAPAE